MASHSRALVPWRQHKIEYRTTKLKFRTICEVLRELAKDAETRRDQLSLDRIGEAYDMAKRMQYKLLTYNKFDIYASADQRTAMDKRMKQGLLDD